MNRRAVGTFSIVLAVLAVGAVIGLRAARGDSHQTKDVIYVINLSQPGATAKPFDSEPDAVAAASKFAGFDVRVPSYLPEKWQVTGINVGSAIASPFRTATLALRHGGAGATILESNQPSGSSTTAGAAGPFPGGAFSSFITGATKNWKLVSDTRAFTLTVPVATPIDDVEAAKILGSLKAQ
jgi:hypothetical protein